MTNYTPKQLSEALDIIDELQAQLNTIRETLADTYRIYDARILIKTAEEEIDAAVLRKQLQNDTANNIRNVLGILK
ncbi:MAG: hypothetical protein Q8S00_32550 [Deltaproteobacteria bacterium]|nr:hypothetical protein [Deltaproteobacteria bacterium]